MNRRVFTVAAAIFAVAGAAAPALAQGHTEGIRTAVRERARAVREAVVRYQGRDNREEQTERLTRTLKVGSNGTIDISNIAGDIVVTAGGGSDAKLDAVKTARGRTVEDAREMLQLVQVDITERGNRAEVRTRYPRGDQWRQQNRRNVNVSVAYTVTAPAGTRMIVNSISGDISTTDIKGDISLESVSGSIRIHNGGRVAAAKSVSGSIEISDTAIEGALDVSSVSGAVRLRGVKVGRLAAGSVSGDVVIEDVDCDNAEAKSVSGNVSFSGPLARNGRYELQSHSGGIRMAVAGGAGFELEATSFSGSVRSDLEIRTPDAERTSGRRQRSLRGVHGDGSAVLDLTTFSGSIVITRR